MSAVRGNQMQPVRSCPSDTWRRRLLAASVASAGLAQACGGLAQDVASEADEDAQLGLNPAGPRGGTAGSSRGRANAASTPGRADPGSSARAEPAPREGELCYSPARIAESTGIGYLIDFLPADARDENGCLTSEYSGWLDGGACNYDPRPAVVRGDQCCHLLDAESPNCERR